MRQFIPFRKISASFIYCWCELENRTFSLKVIEPPIQTLFQKGVDYEASPEFEPSI